MKVFETSLKKVLILKPSIYWDERGFFLETYHQERYTSFGLPSAFVQDNHSHSCQGVLRGLHYQLHRPQAKLVWVVTGDIFDVAVDIRHGSPRFGQWIGIRLSAENQRQMFIPEGFAHGFCVLSSQADVLYKCTDFYVPDEERGIRWNDPALAIDWPVTQPLLSEKDQCYPELQHVEERNLPVYGERSSGVNEFMNP